MRVSSGRLGCMRSCTTFRPGLTAADAPGWGFSSLTASVAASVTSPPGFASSRAGYHAPVSGGSANRPVFDIEFYATPDGDEPVRRWIKEELTPTKRRAIGAAMNRILAQEGGGVCRSEWGRALGRGLYEFRLRDEIQDQGVAESILLRVFFHPYGNKVILLLGGYDKGRHPSAKRQEKEIAEARKRLAEFRSRNRV